MADHFRRILRSWRTKTTSTSYVTIATEPANTFFGADPIVGSTHKWGLYGRLIYVTAKGSTGGGGQYTHFAAWREVGSSTIGVTVNGPQDTIGVSAGQWVTVSGGSGLVIQARATEAVATVAIIGVIMDAVLIGGSQP